MYTIMAFNIDIYYIMINHLRMTIDHYRLTSCLECGDPAGIPALAAWLLSPAVAYRAYLPTSPSRGHHQHRQVNINFGEDLNIPNPSLGYSH